MKRTTTICIIALIVVLGSCSPKKETNRPAETSNTINDSTSEKPYFDQYFVETPNIETSYGPKSITRNILEDRSGHFWMATWEGIIKYDGQSFVNCTNKFKLKKSHVFSLLEDRNGNLWFGTIGAGVYRFDGHSFTLFDKKDGLVNNIVTCIYEDQQGKIWFGTQAGVSCYNGQSFENFTIEDGLTNNDINAIIEDDQGRYWIGTRGDACLYDPQVTSNNVKEKFSILTSKQIKAFVNVRSIIKDKQGTMWMGGNDGLWGFDGDSYRQYTSEFVGYIYEDGIGNVWTSSAPHGNDFDCKLSMYDRKLMSTTPQDPLIVKQEKNMFFGILEDSKKNIWLCHANGVYRYDGLYFEDFSLKK